MFPSVSSLHRGIGRRQTAPPCRPASAATYRVSSMTDPEVRAQEPPQCSRETGAPQPHVAVVCQCWATGPCCWEIGAGVISGSACLQELVLFCSEPAPLCFSQTQLLFLLQCVDSVFLTAQYARVVYTHSCVFYSSCTVPVFFIPHSLRLSTCLSLHRDDMHTLRSQLKEGDVCMCA